MKLCKDCKHIRYPKNPDCAPYCAVVDYPPFTSRVTGQHFGAVLGMQCADARQFLRLSAFGLLEVLPCGPDAKLFEPKEEKE